ncbi:outer membrane porin GjpA [Mycobacterium sp. NAZ190054]|uniref:outer membrane porin GjpA n=1 Tax=Mycobacterium sp. NAZ190054 TaxID=1747766 RepID=UPI0007916C64|nr:outer membrane porin GjpA [Mycobacterium sp. NAZ190054]KWX60693.1 hypothetical protein ASJ79_09075 [Mycobacterium sp. NAZ190054]
MHTTLRPFATAGVALVSASALAVSPLTLDATLPGDKVTTPAVQFTAAVDPITPLLETFNTSVMNFAGLANALLEAPAPVLQQIIANQIGYLSQLPDLPAIVEQMVANLGAALQAPFAIDTDTLENTTPGMSHRNLFLLLQGLAEEGASPIPAALQPLIDFSTTYTSGVLLGLVGPVISPVLALAASAQTVIENIFSETPDFEAAFNALVNTPTAMVDAFLNGGQSLDLTPVFDLLGLDLSPAEGIEVPTVGITFGGLLSPGGSIVNALSFDISIGGVIDIPVPGQGPGAIGSLIGLAQTIAKALGWDGEGNPLAPPLSTPEETLRQINDISLLAAQTVTLDTPAPELDQAVTAEQTTESAPEGPDVSPAVTVTDEEPADEIEPSATEESTEEGSEEEGLEEEAAEEEAAEEEATEEEAAEEEAADPESEGDESDGADSTDSGNDNSDSSSKSGASDSKSDS